MNGTIIPRVFASSSRTHVVIFTALMKDLTQRGHIVSGMSGFKNCLNLLEYVIVQAFVRMNVEWALLLIVRDWELN